jgi:lysophospholipase L1-like esterase
MPFLKNTAVFLLSIIVTLLISEAMVRMFSPQDLRLNFSQWDEYVGFVNIPGIEGTTVHTDYQMTVHINSKGLRDREIDYKKEKNTYRIGVFGDSFTFGEGVQNNETYPKLLENLLNADEQLSVSGKRIEVLNFGIGKTGTSHQYAYYQKEGRKYDLDLVIIGFLGANDFKDNLLGVFKLENGQLIHVPSAYSSIRRMQTIVYYFPFYRWLTAHSHLANLVRKQATVLDDNSRATAIMKSNAEGEMGAENERLAVAITREFLTEFVREAKQDGAELILVNLPAKEEKPFTASGKNETHVLLYNRLEKDLNEIPELEIVDLTPVFAKLPVAPYYFPHDGHMTPAGLQLVAMEIKDYLKPRLIEKFKSSNRGSDDSAPGSR